MSGYEKTMRPVDAVSRYVANQLAISEIELANFPYKVAEVTDPQQELPCWELRWTIKAPPGVKTHNGASRILAPIPSFSDQVIWPDDL